MQLRFQPHFAGTFEVSALQLLVQLAAGKSAEQQILLLAVGIVITSWYLASYSPSCSRSKSELLPSWLPKNRSNNKCRYDRNHYDLRSAAGPSYRSSHDLARGGPMRQVRRAYSCVQAGCQSTLMGGNFGRLISRPLASRSSSGSSSRFPGRCLSIPSINWFQCKTNARLLGGWLYNFVFHY